MPHDLVAELLRLLHGDVQGSLGPRRHVEHLRGPRRPAGADRLVLRQLVGSRHEHALVDAHGVEELLDDAAGQRQHADEQVLGAEHVAGTAPHDALRGLDGLTGPFGEVVHVHVVLALRSVLQVRRRGRPGRATPGAAGAGTMHDLGARHRDQARPTPGRGPKRRELVLQRLAGRRAMARSCSSMASTRSTPARLRPELGELLDAAQAFHVALRVAARVLGRALRQHQAAPLVQAQRLRVHAGQLGRHRDHEQGPVSVVLVEHRQSAQSLSSARGARVGQHLRELLEELLLVLGRASAAHPRAGARAGRRGRP